MHAALDLTGIFAFAISGALMAIRRDFDIVGIAILAVITTLGGGILRDLVLGHTPPPAFARWEYLVVPLAAAAVTFVAHPELERFMRTLLVFDAAGLGLFCVAGTVKALEHGLAPVAAATLGVTTAVGGGVLQQARQLEAMGLLHMTLLELPRHRILHRPQDHRRTRRSARSPPLCGQARRVRLAPCPNRRRSSTPPRRSSPGSSCRTHRRRVRVSTTWAKRRFPPATRPPCGRGTLPHPLGDRRDPGGLMGFSVAARCGCDLIVSGGGNARVTG